MQTCVWNSTIQVGHMIISGEKKSGSIWGALQETRLRTLKEMEELKNKCCTETERTQQLRMEELSRQEKESQSTVNQLTVQPQELQDKVNSLNDSRDFHDRETANRSESSCNCSESSWSAQPRCLLAA